MAKPTPQIRPIDQAETVIGRSSGTSAEPQAIRRDDFERNVWCLLGLPVDVATVDGAMAEIDRAARDNKQLSFVTPNVNWLVRALDNPAARQEIIAADLSLVDGAPLTALAKMLSVPTTTRVAGSDLFAALRRRPAFGGPNLSVFFFGGRDGAAEKAMENLNRDNRGLTCVGALNPGHGDVESMSSQSMIDQINAAKPDFVVVALGAAKGQAWIDRNKDRLSAPVTAHLGAVVDFVAGDVLRAPKRVQQLGLEWLWRIKEEPSLWRRYFSDAGSLVRICATKLLPQIWATMRDGKADKTEMAAEAVLEQTRDAVIVRLEGDLAHSKLRSVRDAFRQAANRKSDVCLDFSGVSSFDRAFLGLVLMLEKNLAANGVKITVRGATRRQWGLLKANEMNYSRAQMPSEPQADTVSVSQVSA